MAEPNKEIFPTEQLYPFERAGPERPPPVCLKEHWNRAAVIKHVLPHGYTELPMDFRPYAKVCKVYRTSAPAIPAPAPPADMVFPPGGEFYPPTRYSQSIDAESLLRRLDRPLKKYCDLGEYYPNTAGDMYSTAPMAPARTAPMPGIAREIDMPRVCLITKEYVCRAEDDKSNWDRSPRLFNNPTKQDRYPGEWTTPSWQQGRIGIGRPGTANAISQ